MGHMRKMLILSCREVPMEKKSHQPEQHEGYADGKTEEHTLDRATAEKWVAKMDKPDGGKGGKWTYEQTSQVMKQKAFDCDPVDFYVAMNAIWSDHSKTLSKHNVTSTDAYADLAYDWVKDSDAKENKSALYHKYIAK